MFYASKAKIYETEIGIYAIGSTKDMEECQGMEPRVKLSRRRRFTRLVNGDYCDGRRASQGSNLHYLIQFCAGDEENEKSSRCSKCHAGG